MPMENLFWSSRIKETSRLLLMRHWAFCLIGSSSKSGPIFARSFNSSRRSASSLLIALSKFLVIFCHEIGVLKWEIDMNETTFSLIAMRTLQHEYWILPHLSNGLARDQSELLVQDYRVHQQFARCTRSFALCSLEAGVLTSSDL